MVLCTPIVLHLGKLAQGAEVTVVSRVSRANAAPSLLNILALNQTRQHLQGWAARQLVLNFGLQSRVGAH